MEQETCFLFFFPATLSEHSKPTKVKKFAKNLYNKNHPTFFNRALFTN